MVGQTWANAVHTTVLKLEGDEFGLQMRVWVPSFVAINFFVEYTMLSFNWNINTELLFVTGDTSVYTKYVVKIEFYSSF